MRELNIIAECHTSRQEGHRSVWKRRYARLDTAIPRATCFAVLGSLTPGQRVVFYHKVTGLQIGVVKVRVGGRLEATWIWDE